MSLHPSLKMDVAGTQQRSVLTRIERIKDLMKKDLWQDRQSVIALPKTKVQRIKAKKSVKAKAEEGTAAAASPAAEAKTGGEAKKEAKK